MFDNIKKRTYEILEVAEPGDTASRIFDIFIMTLIALNVLSVVLGSVEGLNTDLFWVFEIFSVVVFSVEYLLRLWTCNVDEKFSGRVSGRLRYIITPMAIIDLLAVFESPRLSWRLHTLRGWSHEHTKEVSTGA